MRIAATTSFSHGPRGLSATSSMRRRLPAVVTSASLIAMLFVSAAAPAAAATAPAMVQAQGLTDTKVEVLWTPVASATGYDVYRGGVHIAGPMTSTLYDDGGRTANTTYSYTVTATVSGVESAPSAASSVKTQIDPDPTPPAWTGASPALTLGTLTSSSAALSWAHASDNVGVVGYRILRGEDPTTPADIITTDVALSYTATNLKADTDYTFAVQAIDAANNASTPLSVSFHTPITSDSPPAAVTGGSMRVTPFSASRIDITWGTVSGAVGYRIYRDAALTPIGEVDEPASPWFSDTGLTAGSHDYTIIAFSSGGNDAPSSPIKSGITLGASTVKIVRGPTVQWVTPTSARVAWWTNINSTSVVNFGIAGPTGTTATDTTLVQNHVVLLAPLAAATAYQYTVGNGSVISGTARFTTTAAAGTSFSFDAIGDYGAGSVGETNNASRIAGDGAQFLQTLGDNVYSEAKDPDFTNQYSEFDGHFFKQMQPALSAKALWTANGNKEYYGGGAWFNVIWAPNNEKWYSYDWGDAHIVVLDSSQPFDPASPQFAWAQADLVAHQSSVWRIVVIQDPPYSSTSANSSATGVQTNLVPLFQAQRVQLVLSGNSHNYERSNPLINGVPAAGGITYMVSGNGGNAFNPFTIPEPSWSASRNSSLYGYLKVSVSPTAIVLNEISAADGTTLDTATINAAAPPPTGATYHPLAGPVRIVDSRIALGLPTKLSNGVPQSFQVTGAGGVPAGATAITGNLTVTGQTKLGYVSLTTASQPTPSTSTINFPVGDDRANGVTTPLGAGGTLWAVYKSNTAGATAELVFDVTGYFTADATGSTYHPLAGPVRIVDSRLALGLPTKLSNGVPQSFQVTGAGGVPAGATAVTGNVTVTAQTHHGYVSLTTASQPTPSTSTINFPVGDDRANGVTTPLGAGGTLWAVYKSPVVGGSTQLIFDVTGYFTADATGSTYHPLAGPVRIVDSRIALGLPTKLSNGVPQNFQVTGAGGVPAGATAITGNLTVTGQTALGYVSLTTASQATPSTSTINFPVGDDRANGVTTPLGAGGTLWAVYKSNTVGASTQLVIDVTGYFGP
jgi:hypothetical protein